MTHDSKRIPIILEELQILWREYPTMRLCQLLYWLLPDLRVDLFYVEDDELAKLIHQKVIDLIQVREKE